MISRLHISFPFVLITILVFVTLWLDRVTRPPEQTRDDDLYRNPDYIVEDFSGIRMDYERGIQRKIAKKTFWLGERNCVCAGAS